MLPVKILVTGGAGFIGSNLLRYWTRVHPDDSLVCFDSLTYAGSYESIRQLVESGAVNFIKGDIRDKEAVASAMKDVDLVTHLAAESHVDRSIDGPEAFMTTNVMGTMILLNEARRRDLTQFHHVSTDEVFGSLPLVSESKFTETSPYAPNSPYAASKAASDHLVRAYAATYGLRTTITNCGNNYGPYQHPEKFIPRCLTLLLNGEKAPLYGDGRNVRDWIFVDDHCSAIDAVVHKGANGTTYLISGRNEISNLGLAKRLIQILGLPEESIKHIRDRPGHDLRYAIDDSKLRAELGWRPIRSLADGLKYTVDWYKENRQWWEPLYQALQVKT